MARLPAPEDYGMSAPRPSRGMTEIAAHRTSPDLATGKVLTDIAGMMQQEADKLDDVAAEDALNKLRERRIEMSVGEKGFTSVRGGRILTEKPLDTFAAQFDKEVETIGAGIGGPRARARFQARAAAEKNSYRMDLLKHVANETNAYAADTAKATIATESKVVAAGYGDEAVMLSSFGRANKVINDEAKRLGLTGSALELYRQEVLGTLHGSVINKMIADGKTGDAVAYFKANGEEMSERQQAHYAPQVKRANDWSMGETRVTELLDSGATPSEIEKTLSAEAKGNKDFYEAGMHALNTKRAAMKASQAEAADAAQAEINNGTPWFKVRAKFKAQMDPTAVAAFDDRAKQLAKEGSVKTNLAAYSELAMMSPQQLAKTDLNQYIGKLSESDWKTFANRRGKILNGDPDEIKDSMTLAQQLTAAHNTLGFDSKDKEKMGAFDQHVQDSIMREEAVKKRRLNDDERSDIIKKAMIKKDKAWYQFGAETRFFEVPMADRDEITSAFVKRHKKQPTPEQILEIYKSVN